ncbi:MAG: hypothetical protein KBI01_10605 [Oscillospiraceae bacterium]|nr:hypothetical protein [Oscillospiraceae bacterium]
MSKYENWRELMGECCASGKPAKAWCLDGYRLDGMAGEPSCLCPAYAKMHGSKADKRNAG